MPRKRFLSHSPEETEELGRVIARELDIPCVVLLRGALGAGKTTLARGIALGLGLRDGSMVSSPSFSLANQYQGCCQIFHIDLFRLEGRRDIFSTGLDEFAGEQGVTLVEWGERFPPLSARTVVVEIRDAGGDTRTLELWKAGRKRSTRTTRRKERIPSGTSKSRTRKRTRRQNP